MVSGEHQLGEDVAPAGRQYRVFVSYAHDSEQHKEQVLSFCTFLREVGIDIRLDRWDEDRRRDWSTWAMAQLQQADFVLVVASAAYRRRAEGDSVSDDGRGAQFEAALLREKLLGDRETWLARVLPVVLPGCHVDDIPLFLQPRSASHYKITAFTVDGAEELLQVLTARPRYPRPRLGPAVETGLPGTRGAGGTPPAPVLSGLPRQPGHFTGRQVEVGRVVAALRGGGPAEPAVVCAVDGMAGVGKTALAARAAEQLAADFPGGCMFIDLHGYSGEFAPVSAAEALDRLLRRLGVPGKKIPQHVDDRAALYQERLAGRRILVVLDNARDAAHVRPLLSVPPGCGVLITSRDRLTPLDDAQQLSLDVMPDADAVALFRSVVGAQRLAPEDDLAASAARIIECCGRLPLAIRIAAGRHRANQVHTLADLGDRLSDERRRLSELDDGERSVAASFAVSYADLTEAQRRMFALLAIHPGTDLDRHAAAALAGEPVPEAERLLGQLADRHLLDQHVRHRYRSHDLLGAFAREFALPQLAEAEQAAARRRLVDYYLGTAERADTTITPYRFRIPLDLSCRASAAPDLRDYADAWAWLAVELPNLVAACQAAATSGLDTQCWQLAYTMRGFFFLTKRWDPWIMTHELALAAARRLGDRRAEATTLNNIGLAALEQRRLAAAAAHYRHALRLFREVGDEHGEYVTLANLAWILFYRRRYAEFLGEIQRTLDFYLRTGRHRNAAITQRGIALAELEVGRVTDATRRLHQVLAEFGRLGLRLDETMTLNALGEAYARSGDLRGALDWHERALESSRLCGSAFELARAHHRLGQLAADPPDPDPDSARDHWAQALANYEALGAPQAAELRIRLATLDAERP